MPVRRPLAALASLALLLAAGCDDPAPAPPPRPPAGLAAPPPAASLPPETPAAAAPVPMRMVPDFEALAAQVMPAVVSIAVTREGTEELPPGLRGTPFERYFRERYRGRAQPGMQGAGSGFVIDPAGIIVTNAHVVGNASRVVVSLLDGTELAARVLGADELVDLAVLQVDVGRPLPFVRLGRSEALRIGQWVLAAGNPFGLGGSATSGIISALGRNIGAGPFDDFIQTDAAINPGNSGGPLFNLAGEVIGISTAIYSPSGASAGIGFAVPSDLARPVVAQLAAGQPVRRGWLGIAMADAAEALAAAGGGAAANGGVLLARVLPGGPAERGGLRAGDVVVALDGERVATTAELARRIAQLAPGQRTMVTVLRDGRQRRIEVMIAERPPRQG